MSQLEVLRQRAEAVREKYAALNRRQGKAVWGAKEYAMGFAGDVGDLLKLAMAKENLRHTEHADEKLEHELADCLWSVLVLAGQYDIDLEVAFAKTMNELEERIGSAA